MANRLDLQALLEDLLGSRNVYYQPPESVKMNYPAIVYALEDIENTFADDGVYLSNRKYLVTVIDKNPDSLLLTRRNEPMSKLVWDKTGERLYETGVDHGVLYPIQAGGLYNKGVAWNGLTAVTESPSGAEASPIYADNIKYLNLMSAEEFGATIEAYTYPDGQKGVRPQLSYCHR